MSVFPDCHAATSLLLLLSPKDPAKKMSAGKGLEPSFTTSARLFTFWQDFRANQTALRGSILSSSPKGVLNSQLHATMLSVCHNTASSPNKLYVKHQFLQGSCPFGLTEHDIKCTTHSLLSKKMLQNTRLELVYSVWQATPLPSALSLHNVGLSRLPSRNVLSVRYCKTWYPDLCAIVRACRTPSFSPFFCLIVYKSGMVLRAGLEPAKCWFWVSHICQFCYRSI